IEAIREVIEELRVLISNNGLTLEELNYKINRITEDIQDRVDKSLKPRVRKVINGSGVVIHTSLGRCLINRVRMEHTTKIASNYNNLEFNLDSGMRGSRYSHLEDIICKITGAEAALVVNNNAAAVVLVLSGLANNKEVIVSRGELVEIGGSFRIPEVMEQSG